jgi:integrase
MASIQKITNKKYQVVISYTGKDGKRKFKKKIIEGNKPDVIKQAAILEEELQLTLQAEEVETDGSKIKFKDFLALYEEYIVENVTPATYEYYHNSLVKWVIPEIGNKYMSDIKPPHLQAIIYKLQDKGLCTKTIKHIFNPVNGIFKYAFNLCYINDNPTTRLMYPQNKKDDKLHFFTKEQAQIFLGLLKQEPIQYQIYFNLALYGGFRRGELIALTWQDVNPNKGTITINKAIHKCSKGELVSTPKTRSSNRSITVPDICFDLLDEWHKINKNEYIFIQKDGSRMAVDTPCRRFKKIIENYNKTAENPLPVIRLHDLRHTNATLLLANNIDIETVSHRLGHAQCSTTLDIYGHAVPEMDRRASELLCSIF